MARTPAQNTTSFPYKASGKSPRLPATSLGRKLWIITKWTFAITCSVFLLFQLWFLTHILWWKSNPPPSTAFMRQRSDENPELSIQYHFVPYQYISPHLKRALIAAEDAHFLMHKGFDWEGIRLAYLKNQKRGYNYAGGSTISQQLAKNLFLTSDKNFIRKGQEAIITLMLENCWSKARILEVYINVIEWGNGIFGAEAAAQHYFNVSASKLSLGQATRLAAMVPRPLYYQNRTRSNVLQRKASTVRARISGAQIP